MVGYHILEGREKHRNSQDYEERGEATRDRRDYTAFGASELVSGQYGNVHCEKSGSRLGKGDDVYEIFILEPALFR